MSADAFHAAERADSEKIVLERNIQGQQKFTRKLGRRILSDARAEWTH